MKSFCLTKLLGLILIFSTTLGLGYAQEQGERQPQIPSLAIMGDTMTQVLPYLGGQELGRSRQVCHTWDNYIQKYLVEFNEQNSSYALINKLKNLPLEEAISFLEYYCRRSLNAIDVLFEAANLYDDPANPDNNDSNRLFVLRQQRPDRLSRGEYKSNFKDIVTSGAKKEDIEDIKQRCLLYYPYNLCLTYSAYLAHPGAYDRYHSVCSCLNISAFSEALYLWSPNYLDGFTVGKSRKGIISKNNCGFIVRSPMTELTESEQVLNSLHSLCLMEWRKATILKNEERQEHLKKGFFEPPRSYGCCVQLYPPHTSTHVLIYNSIAELHEHLSPIDPEEIRFKMGHINHVLGYMELAIGYHKDLSRQNNKFSGPIFSHWVIDGIGDDITRFNRNIKDFVSQNTLTLEEMVFKNSVVDKFSCYLMKIAELVDISLEVQKKWDKKDYKKVLGACIGAFIMVQDLDTKIRYSEQALIYFKKYFEYLEREKNKGNSCSDSYYYPRDIIDIDDYCMYGAVLKLAAQVAPLPEKKAAYYEQSAILYEKSLPTEEKYREILVPQYWSCAQGYKNAADYTQDPTQKWKYYEKAVEMYGICLDIPMDEKEEKGKICREYIQFFKELQGHGQLFEIAAEYNRKAEEVLRQIVKK